MVIIITVEQKGEKNLLVFSRDKNNKRTVAEVRNFKPYFYAEDFLAGEYNTLYGEKCRKIFTNSSREVAFERAKYNKVYEADIHYTDRYLIDRVPTPFEKVNLRKCFIDIENDNSLDTASVPVPITCVTIYDSFINKFVVFAWRKDIEKSVRKNNGESRYYFSSEEEMLETLIKFIVDTDPDLIIGFNVNFDMTYIVNRCKKLNLAIRKISPMNYIKTDKYGVKVYGRVVLDFRKLVKRNFIRKTLFSYSLENISQHLLKKGKEKIDETPGELWRKDFEKLLEYNIQDVSLMKEIDDKMNVIEFYDTLRRRVGCGWDRLTSFSYLHDIETYRKGRERNVVIPKTDLLKSEKSEGGFVQEPDKGLYDYVLNLDVTSMYPYSILAANISPETLSDDGDIVIESSLKFNSKPMGIIPSIIKDEMIHRENMKKLMYEELQKNGKTPKFDSYNLMQYANKVLMNSIYGLFNTEFYVLKEKRITEAITSFSRQAIHWSSEIVKKEGYKVFYTDTDGIYIHSKTNNLKDAIDIGNYLQEKVNSSYKDFLLSKGIKNGEIKIKFENVYDTFFMGSKKHYFGHLCWNEGNEVDEMVVKGYEVIRVDTAKVCKKMMEDVFKMVLERKNDEIHYYITELKKSMKKMDLEEIGIPKPYKSENIVKTAQFKAVQFSNRYLYADIKEGNRVLLIYGSIKGLPYTEAFAFNPFNKKILESKIVEINWKRMYDVLIDKKVERLYSVLGYDKVKGADVSLSQYTKW